MGETGTTTPTGWYVSAAPPVNGVDVTAGSGTSNPLGAVLGWNYGVLGVGPVEESRAGHGAEQQQEATSPWRCGTTRAAT